MKKQTFAHALSWSEEEGAETYVGGAANRVVSCRPLPHHPGLREVVLPSHRARAVRISLQNAAHPIFNLTFTHADGMLAHFYGQTPPLRYPLHAKK